ncbi:DUF4287 domain-containing protein [Agrococcus jenensis]|uniref:Uncharacterized protein DUF4287 n=1 Tax=Agrococcus jenensis TaxID=46353 RepID=A0A3N2AP57_9MICO|nr:DUF4287 domain-containing protein [Agrococcus jenensis]ROR64776.1 uncharacterized protein DUF4287 [Agrococcus jenensis]
MDVDAATQTMIDNMPAKTGRSLDEWFAVLDGTSPSPTKHGEIMALLKGEHGMSHGFANLVALRHRARDAGPMTADDLVDAQYAGGKAALRPILDRLVAAATALGDDVEVAPKKTSVSLRRRKQFAVVEAASAKRVRVGLNLADAPASGRLQVAGGMCTHRVDLASVDEVDDELLGWLRAAYALA